MKCKQCGKEFDGNTALCPDCELVVENTNDSAETTDCQQQDTNTEKENTEANVVIEEPITKTDSCSEPQKTPEKKKKITIITFAFIALVLFIALVTQSSASKVIKKIEVGEIDNAIQMYAELSAQDKNQVDEKIANECIDLIKAYNQEETSYEEVSEIMKSFDSVVDVEEYQLELENLYDSKNAFVSGKEYIEKKEWENAKAELEKVIEEDINYSDAVAEIEKCNKNISLNHFNNAVQLEKEEKWVEAIEEYEKVAKITSEEYEKATENKSKCVEKLKVSINAQLDQLYQDGKYEEGLSVIETAEKYMKDDEKLQSHKTNFTSKKQEEDRIREENKYNTGITYDQLARYPDDYEGKYVKFTGKVLQVQSGSFSTIYRIGTAGYGYYDNVLYVKQIGANTENRILEDDIVTIKGTSDGLHTYETVMGNEITIPSIWLDSIER